MLKQNSNRTVYSVADLNQSVASMLEQEFAWVWVEGEISNLAKPASGHIYFSLKDSSAQIRCAMFRGRNRNLSFTPENGLQVLVRGKVSLYQPRGDYQLIVDQLEEAGDGLLQKQFEALKKRLSQEGLFEPETKQAIPDHPAGIAVITSPSGAAIRDVLSVIQRRFPSIPVKLYPVPVQGEAAAPAICRALEMANSDTDNDVILLVRGGGSLEDLWSFNEESVARAIFACTTPVVSGVGHEVDFTIADFVADLRAATPTAAAESVTPDQQSWQQTLDWYQQRLQQLVTERLQQHQQSLLWLQKRLYQQHPEYRLQILSQTLQQLTTRLLSQSQHTLLHKRSLLLQIRSRLLNQSPAPVIRQNHQQLSLTWQRLNNLAQNTVSAKAARLAQCASTLQALSPLQTLARGYSITTDENGHAVLDSARLHTDQILTTRLNKGTIRSKITQIE